MTAAAARGTSPSGRVVALMPAWSASEFIGPVLESLAAQTYPNLDVLISVDLCSDGTAEICERYAQTHPNVRVIRQPVRLGWIGNVNYLLRSAQGDYAFFAFHDDPLTPTYVAKLVRALEQHPQAILAFSDFFTTDGTRPYDVLDGVTERFERCRRVFHAYGAWWAPNRGLMRMSVLTSLGRMHRHWAGEYSADWPWLLRLAALGEFVHVREPLLHKMLREKSLSNTWQKNLWEHFAVRVACARVVHAARFTPAQELYLYAESLLIALGVRCPSWLRRARGRLHQRLSKRLAAR